MTTDQIAVLVLGIVGGVGLILMLTGILCIFLQKRKVKNCTGYTTGYVVDYRFGGDGKMCPRVEYRAGGQTYRATRHFRGYVITSRIFSKKSGSQKAAYVSDRDYLHITRGFFINFRTVAEELWPLGSTMAVYYNPEKPRQAYVEKLPEKSSIVGLIFLWLGFGTILVSILVFALIRL